MFEFIKANRSFYKLLIFFFIPTAIVILKIVWGENSMSYVGSRAIIASAFGFVLLGLLLLLAWGVGRKIQVWLYLDRLTGLEQCIFNLAVGLGVVGYGVLIMGLIGILNPWGISLWLFMLSIIAWREIFNIVSNIPVWISKSKELFGELGILEKGMLLISAGIFVTVLAKTMAPPNDYDGLMYHLQAPKLFLQAGRIYPLPENIQANFPFTIEMLFTIGIALQSDVLASQLNLLFALLLVLAVYCFGRQYMSRAAGWLAVAILLGIWIFPLWASSQNVDIAWALYEFLAFFGLVRWQKKDSQRWLMFAGLMAGFAIGTKYMALGGVFVLGLFVLWQSRHMGWHKILVNGVIFGGIALFIGSPWYLKNLVWFGNPVFPFIFGGRDWDRAQFEFYFSWLRGFVPGNNIWDYIILPFKIYIQNKKFSTMMGIDTPSWLFPLVFLYPFTKKSRVLTWMAWVMLLRFGMWALAAQIRFLLPLYPGLSLLTAHVILDLVGKLKSRTVRHGLIIIGVGSLLILSFVIQVLYLYAFPPFGVILGLESKIAYLSRFSGDFNAKQYLQENLDPDARVLMMWSGTGYYCDERCIPDTSQSQWVRIASPSFDPFVVAPELREMGVTHLLFSFPEYSAISEEHDPTGIHKRAGDFFWDEFYPVCAREIYVDPWARIFELSCN